MIRTEEKTLTVESFKGTVLENFAVFPDESGENLCMRIMLPSGNDIQVIIPEVFMDGMVEAFERARDQARYKRHPELLDEVYE